MNQKSHLLFKTLKVLCALTLSNQSFAEPVKVDLESPENAAIFTQGGGFAGSLSAGLGDINGDGFDDVIIAGDSSAYVVFGAENSADIASTAAELTNEKGFTVTLDDPSDRPFSGNITALASGDVDGDGSMDVAISFQIETPEPVLIDPETSQPFDPCSLSRIACKGNYLTVVVSAQTLQAGGSNVDLSTLDSTQSRLLFGAESQLNGMHIADVDGDGRDDILISAVSDNAFGAVVYSKTATDIDLSELDGSSGFSVVRPTTPDYRNARLVAAGDINGDGNQDIAITGLVEADSNIANAAIIFGQSTTMPANVDIDSLDGTNGFHLQPQLESSSFDFTTLAALGDINADGYDDLGLPVTGGENHWILLITGSNDDYPMEVVTNEDWFAAGKGFVIETPEDFCQSFPSTTDVCTPFLNPQTLLAGVGDVNNDGIDDVLFGRFGLNLIHGRASWPTQSYCRDGSESPCCTRPLCHRTVSTEFIDVEFLPRPDSFTNNGLGAVGDINGDQVADMVIPLQNGTQTYITYGQPDRADCIDSDGDGWGWDGVKSCLVMPPDKCDYRDAAVNGGWGWNPATMQSCKPVNDGNECIYSAADQNLGWGWNPVTQQSCPPVVLCIDTDGDGWGWDGVKSCRTDANDLVNLATGVPVETISLEWTEQDLTAAAMVCETFQWSDSANEYLPQNPEQLKQYNHFYQGVIPVPEVPGGWVLDLNPAGSSQDQVFSWTLENGVYQGAAPIGSGNTIEDDPRGFKVWKNSREYSHCVGIHSSSEALEPCLYAGSDVDGDGYGWDDGTSCLVTSESAPVREIYHAGTGEQIDLVKLQWTWGDFWFSHFSCTQYNYSGTGYVADNKWREYVHIGATAEADESGIVKTDTSESSIVNFRIDDLPATIDNTNLYIELNEETNDTFDVYASAGDTALSLDEWESETIFFTDVCTAERDCTLANNVTDLLQMAIDNGDSYLSFKFEGRNGTDGDWLDEAVLSWRNDASVFWLEGGIYNGPAPIDAVAEISDDGGIRSWADDNSYTYCGVKPLVQ